VYNIGGGRDNSVSMLEAIDMVERTAGTRVDWTYVDDNRVGDHICYVSDLRKLRRDYPDWSITTSVPEIIQEMVAGARSRLGVG
jgi:CDP-paratose 2-epimerase